MLKNKSKMFCFQVKTWFQNRRMKHKKLLRKYNEDGNASTSHSKSTTSESNVKPPAPSQDTLRFQQKISKFNFKYSARVIKMTQ